MDTFKLVSNYRPTGDQPQAISKLCLLYTSSAHFPPRLQTGADPRPAAGHSLFSEGPPAEVPSGRLSP